MSAPDYVPVAQARALPGLRIAFTQGVPGPWSVAARAFYDIKKIAYVAVPQEGGTPNEELKAWTGQTSAPVAMLDDDRPRAHWSEVLILAEQLAAEPRLIPADQDERTLMFGLCHEICGDDGLGWNARLLIFATQQAAGNDRFSIMHAKYSSKSSVEHSRRRLTDIVDMLARRLASQAANGSGYFIGEQMTAADIYWAAFSNLLVAMPEELCIMPDFYRKLGAITCAHFDAPVPQILIDHRDRVVRNHFEWPIAL